jgi:PPM family protein phosphatase
MNSLVSLHTISNKIKNEDYIIPFSNENLGFDGFVLADGLGSHFQAECGSRFCSEALKTILENIKSLEEEDLNFTILFKKVYEDLKINFAEDKEIQEIEDKTRVFGTTLICVLELKDKYIIAYLGNGSIWHLRGNFTHFVEQRYLPWSAINLLNPHTIEQNGREALYKFIALESPELQLEPSVITLSKDNNSYGDILIVSTDGLYSNDHIRVAKDEEGGIWISGDIKIEKLFKALKLFLKNDYIDNDTLDSEMTKYKNNIIENNLIDDDTTFGISISNATVKYHINLNENNYR